ncbi:reverse transcriptase domain-containing protein [Tanacetum coccineum]
MQISSFMSSHKCPELAKHFSDNVPRRVDEMLKRVDDYLRSEEAFRNTELPRGELREHRPAFRTPERNIPYVPPQRPNQEVRRPIAVLTLDSLSSTPQEILAIEHQLRLPQPAPLVGVPSKENVNKYCDYHNEKGHNTNDSFHLKQQLELALESGDRASVEIMFEHCFNMLHPSIQSRLVETQTTVFGFSREQVKPLGKIELDVCCEGSGRCQRAILKFTIIPAPSPYSIILGRPGLKQLRAIPSTIHGMMKFLTPWGVATLNHQALTECQSIGKVNQSEEKGILLGKGWVITEEVAEWLKAGIVRPNINAVCPKDYYPLTEIDSKIEVVMGFSLKCFLDAFKGYHQVHMAEEDEDKTAFYTDQGKLAALNRFLSRSAAKSLPFFETLKDITKENKHDYRWTEKAENAFQELKKMILDLPALTTPLPKETLFVYLAASKEAVSAILLVVRQGKQHPMHYLSKTLHDAERNYATLEKMALALRHASRRLRRYFEAHPITVNTDQPIKQILSKADTSDVPSMDVEEINAVVEEEGETWMTPIINCLERGIWPEDQNKARALRMKINQYFMEEGVLFKRSYLMPMLQCVGPLQANYVIRQIHMRACSMHLNARSVVAKAIQQGYYWPTMHRDTREKYASAGKEKERLVDELPNVLWAHRMPLKTSNGETPYSLTFGSEEVIHAEIGMPTHRTMMIKEGDDNEEEIRLNLDLLTERREAAAIREARYKMKMEQYYNKRVCPMSFKVGEYVYRKNEASRVENLGKLGPKWEGPYLIVKAYHNGSYKLRTMDDREVPRVWHAINLRGCYL